MGAGEIAPVSNARVATAPFRRASMVSAPLVIAWATHRRPAESKARRQAERQKTCGLPPVVRDWNPFAHHWQT